MRRSLILIFLSFNYVKSSDLSVGSSCTLKSGASGTCRAWKDCEIIKDLWNKKAITRAHVTECNRYQMTVCCPFSLDDVMTTHSTTTGRTMTHEMKDITTTTTKRRFTSRSRTTTKISTTQAIIKSHHERISQRKCKEYGESVYTITLIGSLIGQKPTVIKTSKCSQRAVSLIVGGTESTVNEFPHQVLLGYSPRNTVYSWACGGSLVSPRFVLTAAHCLFDKQLSHVKKVKVGMHYIDDNHDNDKVFIYNVKETFKHPNYNDLTFNEDIGLIKMDGSVPLNEHILPICLPTKQHEEHKVIATGFGRTSSSGSLSNVLMKVILERFNYTECREAYPEDGYVQIVEETMMCYGHHKKRMDICRGDSGGPIQISNSHNVDCTYTQVGISSFGPNKCGSTDHPSGFTNVYNYLDWIENIVWADEL